MANHYRKQAEALRKSLIEGAGPSEAVDLIRGLAEKIVLMPTEENGRERLAIDLHGDLANMLQLAADGKKPAPHWGRAGTTEVGCGGRI